MKKSLVGILVLVAFVAFGNNWFSKESAGDAKSGIEFSHNKWEEILQQAKDEKKPIFVDVYTTWCGPCRYMNKMVFTNKKAGAFFNQNFISVKIDAENGQGKMIARKFKVSGYPTLVFVNPDGSIIRREEGARTSKQLIKLGKKALKSAEL